MANVMLRNPLTDLQHEVDRLFESFAPTSGDEQSVFRPSVDLWETDDQYVFAFELPGLTKDDVEISYQDGRLQVSGERRRPREDNLQYHRIERRYGRFFRSIPLSRGVRVDDIRARFDEGVLTVEVPKAEEMKPRRIEIA